MAKKLKEVNSRAEIPAFENEDEEHEFWSTHTLSDEFWEKAEPIPDGELPTPRPRKTPVSVRFDDDLITRLKALAAKKHIGYQSLLRRFVAERVYEEEKREGMLD